MLLLVLSLPCVFGYNIWSNVHLIGGRDILDTEDFLVSQSAASDRLAGVSAVLRLEVGLGLRQVSLPRPNEGQGMKFSPKLKLYFQWILPILILIILIQGLI